MCPLLLHTAGAAVQSTWREAKEVGMLAMERPSASRAITPHATRASTRKPPRRRVSAAPGDGAVTAMCVETDGGCMADTHFLLVKRAHSACSAEPGETSPTRMA